MNDYADGKKVECFIQIFDDGSGVDAGTVEYSIATGAGDNGVRGDEVRGVGGDKGRGAGGDEGRAMGGDELSFGPWKKVVNVVSGNPTQVLLEVDFEWGNDNYIRWRADDLMGTGFNESMPYRIWVNSRPEAVISSPDQGDYFSFESEIFFDASASSDEDGDNLSYYWTSNVTASRSIGSKAYLSSLLAPGKHSITLFVSDGHGYNESRKVKIEVGGKAQYERDSDGDGFSDGLEREKGTDPFNGADSPDGEPDIVTTESAGILGEGGSGFFIILGGILGLVIVVLVIFIIIRKKKKTNAKDVPPPMHPPYQQRPYGPTPHPYPRGQHMFVGQQAYGATPQPQRTAIGMPGPQPPHLMLPPGPGPSNTQQFGAGAPNQYIAPQLPQYAQGPQQSQFDQPELTTGIVGGPAYSLPSFSTEQGPQNLERMALPPGPTPSPEQAVANPGFVGLSPFPEQPMQSPILPDMGLPGALLPTPPEPLSPAGETQQFPPEPTQIFPPAPPLGAAASPSMVTVGPSSDNPADLSELDAYISTLIDNSNPPEPTAPAAPPVPEESPAPVTNAITMQCHSCANNYTAEIAQLPALVTCPTCGTQGMIESI